MNKKHNKQEERKIMNHISKIIGRTYKYIRQLCGFENDADVSPDSKSSKGTTKTTLLTLLVLIRLWSKKRQLKMK